VVWPVARLLLSPAVSSGSPGAGRAQPATATPLRRVSSHAAHQNGPSERHSNAPASQGRETSSGLLATAVPISGKLELVQKHGRRVRWHWPESQVPETGRFVLRQSRRSRLRRSVHNPWSLLLRADGRQQSRWYGTATRALSSNWDGSNAAISLNHAISNQPLFVADKCVRQLSL
jgi:hypothetical protein